MVVDRSRKHYLPSFSTDGPSLEKILQSEKGSENWKGVMGKEERK